MMRRGQSRKVDRSLPYRALHDGRLVDRSVQCRTGGCGIPVLPTITARGSGSVISSRDLGTTDESRRVEHFLRRCHSGRG